MKTSNEGVALIAKWEGFRSKAYLDVANIPTIGYGTINYNYGIPGAPRKPVKMGDTISEISARELLIRQVDAHASTIYLYIKIQLTQSQFDALSSFQYNLGAHILKDSGATLAKHINNRDFEKAAVEMKKFNKARVNGVLQEVKGLTNRRNEEAAMLLKKSEKLDLKKLYRVSIKTGTFAEREHAERFIESVKKLGYLAEVKINDE